MIELKGAVRTYRLDCTSTNALCRVEELTGRSFEDVLREMSGRRARAMTVRAFMTAALVDPAIGTIAEAGPIIDDIGGVAVIRAAARAAVKAS